jgi:protein associated with RNAse G/E
MAGIIWTNEGVFVTGEACFIGSNLVGAVTERDGRGHIVSNLASGLLVAS